MMPAVKFNEAYGYVKTAWERILGPSACIDDNNNFFDQGGTSLKALTMFVSLKDLADNGLTFTDLMQHPTITGMARAVSGHSDRRLIEYQPGLAAAPILVLVHPAGAGPEVYEGLIRCLPDEMTVVGVKNPFVENPSAMMTLHELGSNYSTEILERYGANRPFKILGWSLGGLIGAETGWHLQRANAQVSNLFLVDSKLPSSAQIFYLQNLDKNKRNTMLRADMLKRGLDHHTITWMLRSRDAEEKIFISKPSGQLEECQLVLFTAKEIDQRCNSELEHSLSRLADDGEETFKIVRHGHGALITVDGRHHNDILEEAQLIASVIQRNN